MLYGGYSNTILRLTEVMKYVIDQVFNMCAYQHIKIFPIGH